MAKNGSTIEQQAAAVARAFVNLRGTRNIVADRVRKTRRGTEAEIAMWDQWLPHLEDAAEVFAEAAQKRKDRAAAEKRAEIERKAREEAEKAKLVPAQPNDDLEVV